MRCDGLSSIDPLGCKSEYPPANRAYIDTKGIQEREVTPLLKNCRNLAHAWLCTTSRLLDYPRRTLSLLPSSQRLPITSVTTPARPGNRLDRPPHLTQMCIDRLSARHQRAAVDRGWERRAKVKVGLVKGDRFSSTCEGWEDAC